MLKLLVYVALRFTFVPVSIYAILGATTQILQAAVGVAKR